MKRILPFFSIALVMAACNSTPKLDGETVAPAVQQQAQAYNPDTVGLAQFQQWKVQNELADVSDYQAVQYAAAVPEKKVSKAPVRKTTKPAAPVKSNPAPVSSSDNTVSTTNDGAGTISSESGNEAKQAEKKGWSKAAKGAVIGGVAGAAGGAIINKKNPVVGAVIGGVIGAGGGYAIGRGMDKKDGRIELIP